MQGLYGGEEIDGGFCSCGTRPVWGLRAATQLPSAASMKYTVAQRQRPDPWYVVHDGLAPGCYTTVATCRREASSGAPWPGATTNRQGFMACRISS